MRLRFAPLPTDSRITLEGVVPFVAVVDRVNYDHEELINGAGEVVRMTRAQILQTAATESIATAIGAQGVIFFAEDVELD